MFPISPPKPQFASWLIEQVETGQYTGLSYVEPNRFRAPWKHNSRKDCNDEDSKIFRVSSTAMSQILVLSGDAWLDKMLMALLTSVCVFKYNIVPKHSKIKRTDGTLGIPSCHYYFQSADVWQVLPGAIIA